MIGSRGSSGCGGEEKTELLSGTEPRPLYDVCYHSSSQERLDTF
jgi:hypothetical protein